MADVEALAASEITSVIALSDFLKADIKHGGTSPSFDSEIRIQPHSNSKEDLALVKVQVKKTHLTRRTL